jgi:hypothetical protein
VRACGAVVGAMMLIQAGVCFGSVRSVVVTKQAQKAAGVEFTVTATRHPDKEMDAVFVSVALRKEGALARLDEAVLQVYDGKRLTMRVPLQLRERGGEGRPGDLVGTFHMSPDLLSRCVLQLKCLGPSPTSVITYEVQVGTYVDPPP